MLFVHFWIKLWWLRGLNFVRGRGSLLHWVNPFWVACCWSLEPESNERPGSDCHPQLTGRVHKVTKSSSIWIWIWIWICILEWSFLQQECVDSLPPLFLENLWKDKTRFSQLLLHDSQKIFLHHNLHIVNSKVWRPYCSYSRSSLQSTCYVYHW